MSDTRGEARPSSDLVEGIARAVKADLRRQLHGQPLPGASNPSDWSAAGGQSVDLTECVHAALSHISSLGRVVVPADQLADAACAAARVLTEWDVAPDVIEEVSAEIFALSPRVDRAVTDNGWQPIETAPKDGSTIIMHATMRVHWMPGAAFSPLLAGWRPDTPQTTWQIAGWQRFEPPAEQAAAEVLSKDRGEAPNNTPKVRG